MCIDESGNSLGVMPVFKALNLAREAGLDLVEVSPMNNPPVAKIMDYGRFRYDQEKKDKDNRNKSKSADLKEIRLSSNIGEHDMMVKVARAKEFIEKGHKILLSMRFMGRQNIFVDRGVEVLNKFASLVDMQLAEQPKKIGNQIKVNLISIKEDKEKHAETKNPQSDS